MSDCAKAMQHPAPACTESSEAKLQLTQCHHLHKERACITQQLMLKVEVGEACCAGWDLLHRLVERLLVLPSVSLHTTHSMSDMRHASHVAGTLTKVGFWAS